MIKQLLRRFLVFWGVVFISSLVFAATATVLYALEVPITWQFWIALVVGAAYVVGLFWLTIRAEGKGE